MRNTLDVGVTSGREAASTAKRLPAHGSSHGHTVSHGRNSPTCCPTTWRQHHCMEFIRSAAAQPGCAPPTLSAPESVEAQTHSTHRHSTPPQRSRLTVPSRLQNTQVGPHGPLRYAWPEEAPNLLPSLDAARAKRYHQHDCTGSSTQRNGRCRRKIKKETSSLLPTYAPTRNFQPGSHATPSNYHNYHIPQPIPLGSPARAHPQHRLLLRSPHLMQGRHIDTHVMSARTSSHQT